MLDRDFGIGFADPVHDAQTVFRAILDALANPGTIQTLPLPTGGNQTLPAELAAMLLTFCDHDTSVWLSAALDIPAVRDFCGFHTGAPLTTDLGQAQFGFVAAGEALPELASCNLGSQEYPDRSTTLVAQVESLSGGGKLVLRGPGIRQTQTIAPLGLPTSFASQWADNRALFPRGVDLILVSRGQVLGLPRSTRIVEA